MKQKQNQTMQRLLLIILIFISANAFSQDRYYDPHKPHEKFFRFGAKAGVNINKINGDAYKNGFNYNYLLGGFIQFNFSRTFGLQPEINFAQSSSQFATGSETVYNDLFLNGSQKKAKLDYLKIPVLLNVNLGPSKRIKLQVGPQYGSLLKQTVDSLKTNGNLFKNADLSVVGGLWLQLPFINLGARYEVGLNNINDIDNQDRWRSQAVTIFAGFTF
ncbi:MAG: porin family protein [Ginsengibacter sp.]